MTPLQADVLEFIRASIRTRDTGPTWVEIRKACGLSSDSSVAHVLRQLQNAGHIINDPRRHRGIRLADISSQHVETNAIYPHLVLDPIRRKLVDPSPGDSGPSVEQLMAMTRILAAGSLWFVDASEKGQAGQLVAYDQPFEVSLFSQAEASRIVGVVRFVLHDHEGGGP